MTTNGLPAGPPLLGDQVTLTAPPEVTVNVSARLTLSPGYDLENVQPILEFSMKAYMLFIRQAWGLS
ncbi:hypothetical protein [Flavonifractor hominis]|uniref:Uncharacterized protein n=1 Tax=Flavonifractor hominis TaxID=3133178 RepID=A0ABV1EQN1_9FIRM